MIFYFSGTGNTRWAAEKLAAATAERLIFIPEALGKDAQESVSSPLRYALSDGERIGFCFPVHGWQPPGIVRQFIRRLAIDHPEGHYCYALVTCGDSIGRTMEMLNCELIHCGLHAESVFSLVMPESYVCLPFMYTDTPERERQKIETASKQLEDIIPIVVNREKSDLKTHRGALPWLMSGIIGAYFNGKMISDRKFTVDNGLCIGCGKCATVCPVGDVAMADGRPEWHHDGSCTNCLACYHHCPRHAINYGSITKKRLQYYFGHPNQ